MKLKLWLNIAAFVAIGIIVLFGWHDIKAAFEQMIRLDLWVLTLLIPVQFFAFYAIAKVYMHYFKAAGKSVSLKTLLPAAVELNFVNHVFPSGGVSGFSYLTLRLKHESISTAKSTLAQLARFAFTFLSFIGLFIVALLLLAIEDHASGLIILIATALTTTIIFATLAGAYIIGSQQRIQNFSRALAKLLNKMIHFFRPQYPETIGLGRVERVFLELHKDYQILRGDLGKMKSAFAWALAANLAEVALIYITFVAHDAWVNPGAVIIAYAMATLAGLFAILPGGLGVYEPLMAAVLVSAGIPADIALSVTLVSRVATLALALSTGYVLYHITLKRHERFKRA
jgi:hypothetical protein